MSSIDSKAQPTQQMTPDAKRRRALAIGVAAAAGIAGAGFAWWRLQPQALSSGAEAAFWAQSFETPAGGALPMKGFQGRPLVVNFWATWCPPCVEELPLLDRFFKENNGNRWQVVGLAIDQPSSVRTFLQKTQVSFPIGLAGLGGTELGKSLGNLSGGLPFTVVFGEGGSVLHRKMGKVTPTDLRAWAALR
ncbi:MAG TPA: TlpA disulfide reductase family protein [Burkholderiaceae bacterium]|nr:TlpA disulfide reductase family protein [Burkholderiaceae bacterium]